MITIVNESRNVSVPSWVDSLQSFRRWLETDEFNNLAWVKFSLTRRGANAKITILEQSACTPITCGSPSNP